VMNLRERLLVDLIMNGDIDLRLIAIIATMCEKPFQFFWIL
jgi:hypothetical protein